MIDLSSSSNEEDLIADTSHDFEFAQRLYDELNCAILGPPGDSKIISDFDEEEVREKKTTGTEDTTAFVVVNPASTTFADTDDALRGQKMIMVMIRPPIRKLTTTTAVEVTLVSLRLSRQEGAEADMLQGELQ
jgi:hypothetical protein